MQNSIVTASVLFLAGAIVICGTTVWYVSQQKKAGLDVSFADAPSVVDATTIAKAEQEAAAFPHVPTGTLPLQGTIVTAEKKSLSIKSSDGRLLNIQLGPTTELYKLGAPKDPQAYQKELTSFISIMKLIPDRGEVYLAPDQNIHIPLSSPADMSIGSTVEVMSSLVSGDMVQAVRVRVVSAQ